MVYSVLCNQDEGPSGNKHSRKMEERFTISCDDRKISGILHLPPLKNPHYVITCHGLFSSMQTEKLTAIADVFSKNNLAVIRFDFGGCGESTGSISDTTVSRRLQELEAVAGFASGNPLLGKKYGLLGSSLGGFVALFFAAKNPVNAISVWATPFNLIEAGKNIPEEDLAVLKKDFFTDAEAYNLPSALTKIHTVQVIQGKQDEIVPWQHAHAIYSRVNSPKQIEVIPNGDHSITGSQDRELAIGTSLAWFKKYIT